MEQKLKLTLLSGLASVIEYYDFIIYGMMVGYLSQIFFTGDTPSLGILKSFSILAVGYLARPIGGSLFGLVADIYGRKRTLLGVMVLMAVATGGMGLLPSYAQAGFFAPLLLILCRFLQGLSFGAEIPNVTTIIKEHAQKSPYGKYFGLIISSTGLGAILASFAVTLLTKNFSEAEILQGAWRFPFLLGGVLAFIILIVRNAITETPEFLKAKSQKATYASSRYLIKNLFKDYKTNLLAGIFVTLFFSYLIMLSLYLPVYLNQQFNYQMKDIFFTQTLGIFLSVILAPLFGYLADRYASFTLLKVIPVLFIVFLYYSLLLLKSGSHPALTFFLLFYQVFIACYASNCLMALMKLFPLSLRATGLGLCYNLAYSLASLCPLLLTHFIDITQPAMSLILFTSAVVFFIIVGQQFCLKSNRQTLAEGKILS